MDGEQGEKPGHLQDRAGVGLEGGEVDAAVSAPHPLLCSEDCPDPGAAQVHHPLHIEDKGPVRPEGMNPELLLEIRRGPCIKPPLQGQDQDPLAPSRFNLHPESLLSPYH